MPALDRHLELLVLVRVLGQVARSGGVARWALLECLLASPGLVLPAEELLERVWDEAADPFTSAVKHTIHRLRAKLGDPPVIQTIREGGYRIGPP